MKLFSAWLLIMTVIITICSCKKVHDLQDVDNSFTYNGKKYNTNFANFNWQNVDGKVKGNLQIMTSAAVRDSINMVSIDFNQKVLPLGTLTFLNSDASAFDSSKNFDGAMMGIDSIFVNENGEQVPKFRELIYSFQNDDGQYKAEGSTVTIKKDGSSYDIAYDLIFKKTDTTHTVKGQFKGHVY